MFKENGALSPPSRTLLWHATQLRAASHLSELLDGLDSSETPLRNRKVADFYFGTCLGPNIWAVIFIAIFIISCWDVRDF